MLRQLAQLAAVLDWIAPPLPLLDAPQDDREPQRRPHRPTRGGSDFVNEARSRILREGLPE